VRVGRPLRLNATFWTRLREEGSCWVWTGAKDRDGYGVCTTSPDHKQMWCHRFAYEHMVCEIPPGLQLDHLCRNKACVNPWHMEVVSPFVNNSRAHANPVHAPCGQPRGANNKCRPCDLKYQREYYQRRKARRSA